LLALEDLIFKKLMKTTFNQEGNSVSLAFCWAIGIRKYNSIYRIGNLVRYKKNDVLKALVKRNSFN
jgi:hypothetical protein